MYDVIKNNQGQILEYLRKHVRVGDCVRFINAIDSDMSVHMLHIEFLLQAIIASSTSLEQMQ